MLMLKMLNLQSVDTTATKTEVFNSREATRRMLSKDLEKTVNLSRFRVDINVDVARCCR